MPLITVTQYLAWDSTFCLKKGHRNKTSIQTQGFRMTLVASEAVSGASRSTLYAGEITGWWWPTTAGRGPRGCPRGVGKMSGDWVSSLLRYCQAPWARGQGSASCPCWLDTLYRCSVRQAEARCSLHESKLSKRKTT